MGKTTQNAPQRRQHNDDHTTELETRINQLEQHVQSGGNNYNYMDWKTESWARRMNSLSTYTAERADMRDLHARIDRHNSEVRRLEAGRSLAPPIPEPRDVRSSTKRAPPVLKPVKAVKGRGRAGKRRK